MVKRIKTKNKKKVVPRRKATPFLQTLSPPVAYGMSVSSNAKRTLPIAVQRGDTAIVKNFELVGSYTTPSADFQLTKLEANPGNSTTFPWLSSIGRSYQKFRFLYFRAFFSSTVATNNTGSAYLQLQYDNQDTDPSTIGQIMAGDCAASGPTWFGGAVNSSKAFDSTLNMDSNIFVDMDAKRLPFDWYYIRNSGAGIATHASLTGAPVGGIGTLALTDGSYVDQTALPFRILYGSNISKDSSSTRISPGQLYVAYIVEFAEPVAPALSV
jgi:hypothetical protein